MLGLIWLGIPQSKYLVRETFARDSQRDVGCLIPAAATISLY